MKNTVVVVFGIAALIVSGVCVYQARQLQRRKAETSQLQTQVEAQAEQLDRVKSAQESLKVQRLDLADKLDATSEALQSAQQRAALATSNAASAEASAKKAAAGGEGLKGIGSAISKMLDNPEMKSMIATQQRAMMDTMYGPLFKDLGLTKEQTDQFKELLLAQQMKNVEQAGSLFGGKTDPKDRAALAKTLGEANKQSEDDIKAFLGDERYSLLKDYRETIGERMQLSQLSQQLANTQTPLTGDQQSQLIAIMKEERKTLATDFTNLGWSGGKPADPADAFNEEKLAQYLDLQQNLNDRVLERAKAVLQPEQLDAFGGFQTNQLAMQRLGMKMMQGMMGNERSAAGETKPTP